MRKNKANIKGRPGTSNYGTGSDNYPPEEIDETPASQTVERALQTHFWKAACRSLTPMEGSCSKGSTCECIRHFPATLFWILVDWHQPRPKTGQVSLYKVAKAAPVHSDLFFFKDQRVVGT